MDDFRLAGIVETQKQAEIVKAVLLIRASGARQVKVDLMKDRENNFGV